MHTLWQTPELLENLLNLLVPFKLLVDLKIVLKVNWVELLEVPVQLVLIVSVLVELLQLLLAADHLADGAPCDEVATQLAS